jgi:hypothetical protein
MFKNVDLNSATYFGTLFKKSEIPRRSKKTIPKIGDQMGQRALPVMKYVIVIASLITYAKCFDVFLAA